MKQNCEIEVIALNNGFDKSWVNKNIFTLFHAFGTHIRRLQSMTRMFNMTYRADEWLLYIKDSGNYDLGCDDVETTHLKV